MKKYINQEEYLMRFMTKHDWALIILASGILAAVYTAITM